MECFAKIFSPLDFISHFVTLELQISVHIVRVGSLTFKGNWLHWILFRGIIIKGSTYL